MKCPHCGSRKRPNWWPLNMDPACLEEELRCAECYGVVTGYYPNLTADSSVLKHGKIRRR